MKKLVRFLLFFLLALIAIGIALFGPIDRRPLFEKEFYQSMMSKLDSTKINSYPADSTILMGWNRENLIPDFVTPMAGYSPRSRYETVHDSLFVNTLLIDNGSIKIAFVSYDLLITPPQVEKRIQKLRKQKIPDVDFIYFSASHTHNGIGGWDNTLGGQLMTGKFDEKILDNIVEKTFISIKKAHPWHKLKNLRYFEVPAGKYVQNRLNADSPEDGALRSVEFTSEEGQKAILTSYSAHATNISSKSRAVSGDYPGRLNRSLESSGYDFAMFMAGTVGSHRLDSIDGESFDKVNLAAEKLGTLILNQKQADSLNTKLSISCKNIPIEFGESQMRISDNLRLRDWAYRDFFAPLEGEVQYLKMGNIIFLGMPCDFSGEIVVEKGFYNLARKLDKHVIITSFNGDYVGYITEDHHYDVTKRAEVREMNWVGPYYGNYFYQIVEQLIQK